MKNLSQREVEFIHKAVHFLEQPGFLIHLANAMGKPLELAQRSLPKSIQTKLSKVVENSLKKTLDISFSTLPSNKAGSFPKQPLTEAKHHTYAAAITGAVGGFFGPFALAIELPISTGIMFRSIGNIAQSFGEDLTDPTVKFECLQVFAMGSKHSTTDDAMNSAYLSQRLAFNTFIKNAAQKGASTLLGRLLTRVAAQYEVVVTEKFLAESLPIFGSLGGAAINVAFTNYFSHTAYYHFGLRYLERKHGSELIQKAYLEELSRL